MDDAHLLESPARLASWLATQTQSETQSDEVRRRFDVVRRIAIDLVSETDLETLLQTIIRHAIELLAADDGVFFLHRSEADLLEWRMSIDADHSFEGVRLARGEGLAGKAWDTGRIVQVADYNNWEGRSTAFAGRPNRSVIAAPLSWRNDFLGVMTFSVGSPRRFTDSEVELLGFFAAQTSVAVHNAKVNEENQRRVRELTVIHEATQALARLRSPGELALEIIRILEQVVAYEYSAVLLIDPDSNRLLPFALSDQGKDPVFVEEDKRYVISRGPEVGKGITGWVALHGESIRLGDVRTDPRYFAMRDDIRSELCVPLVSDGQVMGVINTETTRAHAYSLADQRLLETVAGQFAIAIQNSQLIERERHAGQELRNLTAYLQTALEEERTHISRLIHDNFGQALTALKFDLFWLRQRLPGMADVEAKIAGMSNLIDQTINGVRRLSSQLRPGILDDLGLTAALEWQAEEFAQRTGVDARVVCDEDHPDLSPELATLFFRISQEALTNVARHAQATRVRIHLHQTGAEWVLEIKDNGIGMDPAAASASRSLGLLGMRERVHPFDGSLTFISAPGQGTNVRVRIPLARERELQ